MHLGIRRERGRERMAKRVKVTVEGQEFDAIELQFDVRKEDWNEYDLLDGGRIRLKTSVLKILRVLDSNGNPASTPDGEPHYLVRHRVDIVA